MEHLTSFPVGATPLTEGTSWFYNLVLSGKCPSSYSSWYLSIWRGNLKTKTRTGNSAELTLADKRPISWEEASKGQSQARNCARSWRQIRLLTHHKSWGPARGFQSLFSQDKLGYRMKKNSRYGMREESFLSTERLQERNVSDKERKRENNRSMMGDGHSGSLYL